ncbi:MAG: ABC transporter substrate-binding protein [Spirochaetae bacterium HGW-Spirochaetae-8]|nr:MAG: ABC transporter substrate-binding protein [Spirochaetae bacterium HGW-Spirochaetae-8]
MESAVNKRNSILVLLGMLILVGQGLLWAAAVSEARPIRIGIMPDVDSLPFLLAQEERLFTEHDVQVQLVPFQSPVERDAAFQAGQLDGFVGDTLGAVFLEQSGFDIAITSITNGRYGLVASPKGTITSLGQLGGVAIAVSSNTIIEFIAYSLVVAAGVPSKDFTLVAIPKIPVRMEVLLNGQAQAACLPEPFYTLAVANGARAHGDSTALSDAPGIMIFSASVVKARQADLKKVYGAYWEAAQKINSQPEAYRDFLVLKGGFPQTIRDLFQFVTYTKPQVPNPAQVAHVVDWLQTRGLLKKQIAYDDLVDGSIVQGF